MEQMIVLTDALTIPIKQLLACAVVELLIPIPMVMVREIVMITAQMTRIKLLLAYAVVELLIAIPMVMEYQTVTILINNKQI
jgi:hypothetical protein